VSIAINDNRADSYEINGLPADVYYISMATIDEKDMKSELSEILEVDLR
jgi:hypothetical protein